MTTTTSTTSFAAWANKTVNHNSHKGARVQITRVDSQGKIIRYERTCSGLVKKPATPQVTEYDLVISHLVLAVLACLVAVACVYTAAFTPNPINITAQPIGMEPLVLPEFPGLKGKQPPVDRVQPVKKTKAKKVDDDSGLQKAFDTDFTCHEVVTEDATQCGEKDDEGRTVRSFCQLSCKKARKAMKRAAKRRAAEFDTFAAKIPQCTAGAQQGKCTYEL